MTTREMMTCRPYHEVAADAMKDTNLAMTTMQISHSDCFVAYSFNKTHDMVCHMVYKTNTLNAPWRGQKWVRKTPRFLDLRHNYEDYAILHDLTRDQSWFLFPLNEVEFMQEGDR